MSNKFFKANKGLHLNPQTGTPPNLQDGNVWYETSKFKFRENGITKELGSGGGSSGINYITGGDAETGTTGWTTYADAVQFTPEDGTGGSPSVTFTTSNTNPLRGDNSFIFTKDAANRQGEGVAYDFTIDSADVAKVLTISFDYSVNSGTYVDDYLTVYIYDITNAQIIEPLAFGLGNSLLNERFITTFQTNINSTSYRLIFHVATSASDAFSIKLDNIVVGPTSLSYGAIISDWISFTPTGTFTNNTTYQGRYRRVGDTAEIEYYLSFAGAPNTVTLTLNMPLGLSIDLTKTMLDAQSMGIIAGVQVDANADESAIAYRINSSTVLGVLYPSTNASTASTDELLGIENTVTHNSPRTIASGDAIYLKAVLPISGWSTSTQMSHQNDTRTVAFSVGGPPTGAPATGSLTAVSWGTADVDTHGGFDGQTYVIPVTGLYHFGAMIAAQGTGLTTSSIDVYKNNGTVIDVIQHVQASSTRTWVEIEKTLPFVAGDNILVRFRQHDGSGLAFQGNTGHFFCHKLGGTDNILRSESVVARAINTTTNVAASQTTIVGNTVSIDTHSIINTSTGLFTVPQSGKYRVNASVKTATISVTAGDIFELFLQKNSAPYSSLDYKRIEATNASWRVFLSGTDTVSLLAGETIRIRASFGVTNVPSEFQVSLERIGN